MRLDAERRAAGAHHAGAGASQRAAATRAEAHPPSAAGTSQTWHRTPTRTRQYTALLVGYASGCVSK